MPICSKCGDRIDSFCLNQCCKDAFQKDWERKVNDKINDYQNEVSSLKTTDPNDLTLPDYLELIKIKIAIEKWTKERYAKNSPVLSEVKNLLQEIEETENKFLPRIKLQYQKRGKHCSHRNIQWDDFFKQEKKNNAWCLDCGDIESNKFGVSLQMWYRKKISEWITSKGFKIWEFEKFLRKENYIDVWYDIQRGKMDSLVNDFTGQAFFWEMAGYIEEYCLEFAKEKGINVDNNTSNKKREREREQIYNLKLAI